MAAAGDRSPWRDLAQGWAEFRAHPWLQVTTIQFALFNLLTWAPFLLLTPILAQAYLGGARGYGIVQASLAVGAIVAGLLLVGRRPRRPLVTAVIGSFGYAAPCLALAVHAPLAAVAGAAALAGAGSATFVAFSATVTQQRVPADMLSRVTAIELTGAYASARRLRGHRPGRRRRRRRPRPGPRRRLLHAQQRRRPGPPRHPRRPRARPGPSRRPVPAPVPAARRRTRP